MRPLLKTKGVRMIDIDWRAKALNFPIGRYADVVPSCDINVFAKKTDRSLLGSWRVVKLPCTVEAEVPGRLRAVSDSCKFPGFKPKKVCSRSQFIPFNNSRIFPIGNLGLCGIGSTDGAPHDGDNRPYQSDFPHVPKVIGKLQCASCRSCT